MCHVSGRLIRGFLFAGLVVAASGCIIRVPITDNQEFPFPEGVYDVSLGGASQEVFNLTAPVASESLLPGRDDFIVEFITNRNGTLLVWDLVDVDHAWVESFAVAFDGSKFEINSNLTVRILGPDGELGHITDTGLFPVAGLEYRIQPSAPLDLMAFSLSEGESLRVEFTYTGRNPAADVPVNVRILTRVELHTRGFIDVGSVLP